MATRSLQSFGIYHIFIKPSFQLQDDIFLLIGNVLHGQVHVYIRECVGGSMDLRSRSAVRSAVGSRLHDIDRVKIGPCHVMSWPLSCHVPQCSLHRSLTSAVKDFASGSCIRVGIVFSAQVLAASPDSLPEMPCLRIRY